MKQIIPLLLFALWANILFAQDFKGQWKGQFIDKSAGILSWASDDCDYVLELETKGTAVTGYSYTYFTDGGGSKFYTICKLKGKINKASRYIEVTEYERTKTNVPQHIRNCFQTHKLTYFKQGDTQTLEGSWIPAPNQEGDCGFGTTILTRRELKTIAPKYNSATSRTTAKPKPKTNFIDKTKKTNQPVVKTSPKKADPPLVKKIDPNLGKDPVVKEPTEIKGSNELKQKTQLSVEKRNNTVLKTIEVENETFKVNLYDNGDIDGDSISLFYNGKVILSNKRLTDKPITLTLNIDDSKTINELVMYAENLGTIPPNTALMIVNDGDKRYEVRISSDLQKSGTIRFVHKPK